MTRRAGLSAGVGTAGHATLPPVRAPRTSESVQTFRDAMKLTIERGALLKSLAHVQSVVERRNTIPILSNVLITAQKGRLSLAATDMDLAITETVEATAAKSGSPTAPPHN